MTKQSILTVRCYVTDPVQCPRFDKIVQESASTFLRGSRPVLSCETGRVGVSVKILRPTDRSQNPGRTKLLSDSETGRSVVKNRSDKVNY